MNQLFYVHDPMCSWCWAFEKTKTELLKSLPADIKVVRLLGGLAADSNNPMPDQQRTQIQNAWQNIEKKIPDVKFNFDFWEKCLPRRSTYPACRAIITARQQNPKMDELMTTAIQQAYYKNAQNPSDDNTLIHLAEQLELDTNIFTQALNSETTQETLMSEIASARKIGANSFPSLILRLGESDWRIPIDYLDTGSMLDLIQMLMADSNA